MINIVPSRKTLNFSAINETKDSFIEKFLLGENFIVKTTMFEYNIKIEHLALADGSGKHFLFKASLVKGTSAHFSGPGIGFFSGYFDSQNKSGWLRGLDRLNW